jgi:energy-coupling factor transporter ATP-binding protein EcfA2
MNQDPDQLPPHSDTAEAGLIGCMLLAGSLEKPELAAEILTAIEESGPIEMFYDLRHRKIVEVMANLHREGRPHADMLLLQQRLMDGQLLEQVGGAAYLTSLGDSSALSCWPEYLAEVNNKWLARRTIEAQGRWRAMVGSGVSESVMGEMAREMGELQALAGRNLKQAPKDIARCTDLGEKIWALWTGDEIVEPGMDMPFEFPLKFRPSEVTLMTGDNGSGKSSMLSQIAVCLAKQQWKVFMASLEVPPEVTYWMILRQLLGRRGPSSDDLEKRKIEFRGAMMWMKERILMYDFTGITNWRGLLDIFTWLRANAGVDCFVLDSVMRIGIPDDDFAEQGIAAARFADFAVKTGSHLFLVIHENKGDGSTKMKIRGSKQWSDNAHNVCSMLRNEKKAEKIAEIRAQMKSSEITEEEGRRLMNAEGFRKEWDSKFRLHKQRWPGSQQNGSRHLYFYHPALQFLEHWDDPPYNYLPKKKAGFEA